MGAELATSNGADVAGDAPQLPADAPPWTGALFARLDAIEAAQRTAEGHLGLLVDFAGKIAEQMAAAAPVVDAIAKGGIGGVLGLLRNKG